MVTRLARYLREEISIAPLIILRIAFGSLMLLSVSRFIAKGWVYKMYVLPKVFFPYYGFEWVKPLSETGMYVVFAVLLLSTVGIIFGAFYRASIILFFLLLTYVELIDKTNYLNHYYFVSLFSFILLFLPAGRNFSVDNRIFNRPDLHTIPRLFLFILQLQMFLVYFFAGIAKLNYEWLIQAQPLSIWLPAFSHFPVIGSFMEEKWLAFVFCWFGCFYDLLIGFFLFNKRTVNTAYFFVVVFHLATALFFNIGMFPYIMMTITVIFFKESFHEKILCKLKRFFSYRNEIVQVDPHSVKFSHGVLMMFSLFFLFQFLLPFRFLLYPGKLFWTEQGYRFSWRVMLMEKAGTAFFTVIDKNSAKRTEVDNKDYLTYMQEKMMSTQPDMMVDYAKFLKEEFKSRGYADPEVHAQSYVTVNGSGSREFIDYSVDLASQSNSIFSNKSWVRSY